MSRGKKLLGLFMAIGLSVGMSVTPALAETTSILDAVVDRKNLQMRKQQQTLLRIPATASCEEQI